MIKNLFSIRNFIFILFPGGCITEPNIALTTTIAYYHYCSCYDYVWMETENFRRFFIDFPSPHCLRSLINRTYSSCRKENISQVRFQRYHLLITDGIHFIFEGYHHQVVTEVFAATREAIVIGIRCTQQQKVNGGER